MSDLVPGGDSGSRDGVGLWSGGRTGNFLGVGLSPGLGLRLCLQSLGWDRF